MSVLTRFGRCEVPVARPWTDARASAPFPGPRAVSGVLAGEGLLQAHLQPIVDLATGEIWGVEALSRFPGHPQPGPSAWFASATGDGRGVALEELALRTALEVVPQLPARMCLTVNLSARSLLEASVQELLSSAAGPCLVVELTEHEQVLSYPDLLEVLASLRANGLKLAIDDFGAGHSSLQHVLQLEPDVVKLDLTLVQGIGGCARRAALVEAVRGFCTATGTALVAEGVEEAEDLAALVRLGVSHAQGWFLARPAPVEVVLPVLEGGLRPPVLVLPS